MRADQPIDSEGVGYPLADVEAFLAAADRRMEELRTEIAQLRARRASVTDDAGAERRAQIADAWMSAHLEAETIRAAADHEAEQLVARARADAGRSLASTVPTSDWERPA